MRQAILRGATGRLGVVIGHGPHALARGRVHDPTVIGGRVTPQLTHRVHLDVGWSRQLEAAAVCCIAFRLDGDRRGPHERIARPLDFLGRGGVP